MNLPRTIVPLFLNVLLAAYLLLCSLGSASAQPSDTIVANPQAITLRHIWKVTGVNEQDRVGNGVGYVPDINADTFNEFLVHFGREAKWKLFYGGEPAPDTTPEWEAIVSAPVPSYPITGDFWGDGRHAAVTGQYRFWDTPERYLLYFFRQDQNTFAITPDPVMNPLETMSPPVLIGPTDIISTNLDNEPGDELLLSIGVHTREGNRSQVGEIWIYQGGPEFEVDVPTLVIRDQEETQTENQYFAHLADFDGDVYIDLLLETTYRDGRKKFKFWYGSAGSPWNWTDTPDRVLLLDGTGLNLQPIIADFDGDHIADIAATVYEGEARYIHIYRSRAGKDFRTRTFARTDADNVLATHLLMARHPSVGYLNDTTRRFAMLPLLGPSLYNPNEPMMLLFSGGENGPDSAWDAVYAPSRDEGVTPGGVMQHIAALPDCNGDGWDDLLISDDDWWSSVLKLGIAMVIAGGPEIPSTGVREEPVAGETGGLYLWPNPVRDELNIAWKGNLKKMPQRFEVHDVAGRRVASGRIEPYVGAAQWRCADLSAGAYLLTAFDGDENVIASTTIIKE